MAQISEAEHQTQPRALQLVCLGEDREGGSEEMDSAVCSPYKAAMFALYVLQTWILNCADVLWVKSVSISVIHYNKFVEKKETNFLSWRVAEPVPVVTCVYQPKQATYIKKKNPFASLLLHIFIAKIKVKVSLGTDFRLILLRRKDSIREEFLWVFFPSFKQH